MEQLDTPSCSRSLSPMVNKKSRNFLKLFFRTSIAERNVQNYVLREGSITQNAWNGMSKQSNWKVRLRTLENLEEVVKKRRLQVGTLEGIWAETSDMLGISTLRTTFLKFMCSLTRAQREELGSALRSTFFETIKKVGFGELSVQWLVALTDDGRNMDSLEYCIGELLVDWLDVSFWDTSHHSDFYYTSVLELIELIEKIFIHNSTFIKEAHLQQIISRFCKKMCNCQQFFIMPLLSCCEAALKYSHIPKNELMPLIVALCLLLSNSAHRQNTWRLMRILLSSVNAYTVLRILQAILSNFYHEHVNDIPETARIAVVRGAVFCVAMALWGSQRIDSLKVSSSIIVPALSEAMTLDLAIAREVLLAIRRLVGKFGKSLQQLTWTCVIQLLENAARYVKIKNITKSHEVYVELLQIILVIENLYLQNEYCGSFDAFFQLVETFSTSLPDESVFHLIDYRISCIDPLSGDWISQTLSLIRRHINPNNPVKHREKALCVLGDVYHKYRLLYETEVVRRLSLVICSMIPEERNTNFQYQLIMFLFDVAKSVSVRVNNDLFSSVMQLIRNVINSDVPRFVRSDNLEITAFCIGELLNERWCVLDGALLNFLINIIIEHLNLQYSLSFYEILGSDVRVRLFETLLLIQMEPSTQKLARAIPDATNAKHMSRVSNPHIVVESSNQTANSSMSLSSSSEFFKYSEFKWEDICKITIKALRIEKSWPVVRKILECLNRLLEFRCLVYSAGETFVNYFVSSTIELFHRFERNQFILHANDEFWHSLCHVLGKLVNYSQDVQLCKTIVECVKSGCVQAIVTCNLAIQVLPEKMAILSRQLIEYLLSLRPCGQLAVSIIELVSDCADAERFHQFFQEKQFKNIVDILAPYSNSSRFNIFVVISVYSALMRWFVHTPDRLRPTISRYIADSLMLVRNDSGNSIHSPGVILSPVKTQIDPPHRSTENILNDMTLNENTAHKSAEGSKNATSISLSTVHSSCTNDSYSSSNTVPPAFPTLHPTALFDYGNSQTLSRNSSGGSEDSNSRCLSIETFAEKAPSDSTLTVTNMTVISSPRGDLLKLRNPPNGIPSTSFTSNNQFMGQESAPMFCIGPPTPLTPTPKLEKGNEDNITDNGQPLCSHLIKNNLDSLNGRGRKNSIMQCYEITDELMDMLSLFMSFWRKGLNTERQPSQTYSDFVFIDEMDMDTMITTSDAPWSISEKNIEHWISMNSVITIRVLQRTEIGNRTLDYRKTTFSGNRPLSTSGIDLLANEMLNEGNAPESTDPVTIESRNNQNGDGTEICGGLARSNSSPPNPLAMFSRALTNDKINEQQLSIRPLNSTLSTRPFDNGNSEDFTLPNQFRRRNFSNTQGMRRNPPSFFSSIKFKQPGAGGTAPKERICDIDSTPHTSTDTQKSTFNLEYVQVILRHAFGKESWIMRPYSRVPVDFHTGVGSWLLEGAPSFFLHMGGGINSTLTLRVPPKENEAVQRSLRILDHMKAIEMHAIGVLYIGEDQTNEAEILSNQYGSERYMKFIRLLGDIVPLDDGAGGLQEGKHGDFTYEYRDALSQIVFLIATLMPNSQDDPKCNAKKSLIGNNFVSVVFNESGKPYRLGTISGKFNKITIEVIPHDEETVVLKLHARREITCWMAMTSAYLADSDAVHVLRRLIVRAQLSVNVSRSIEDCRRNNELKPYLSQAIDRLRKIRALRLKGVLE